MEMSEKGHRGNGHLVAAGDRHGVPDTGPHQPHLATALAGTAPQQHHHRQHSSHERDESPGKSSNGNPETLVAAGDRHGGTETGPNHMHP